MASCSRLTARTKAVCPRGCCSPRRPHAATTFVQRQIPQVLFPLCSPSWRSSTLAAVLLATFYLIPSCLGFHGDEDVQCSQIPRAVHPAPLVWFIHCHHGSPPFPNLSTQQTSCSFVTHGRAPDGDATGLSYHHLSSWRHLHLF
ncbi:uncharacterized protein [Triticum aestivum]|uniref:uncharacterized protein n=1 Tax=Triticum aestivum TaxID=4565 RepID=UPI001D029967|nr:uncharacterized protein LOC123185265 [Triticum aestivum]